MNNYKISVIIPIYNQERKIKQCIQALQKQTIDVKRLEIILINDGSTDCTDTICRDLIQEYSSIIYITQNNLGVSSARNAGIQRASGKYIFYLDADDELENCTIEKVSEYFDQVYDQVDLVTYKIETIFNGRILNPHFRYLYLKDNGVYDLKLSPYIGQTTMNIAVKNKFQNNILFDTRQTFSEDQKYCCDVMTPLLKMGYCKEGRYIYHRSNNSSSGRLGGSCYIFEQCMKMFEDLFAQFDHVPLAYQGLYVNDIYWKLHENILFPYHYDATHYEEAVGRIQALFSRCNDWVILNHPAIDFFEKYYLLTLKKNNNIRVDISPYGFALLEKNEVLFRETSIEIVITHLTARNGEIYIDGFIKSAFLNFYDREPMVCAIENGGKLIRKMQLSDSSHNYYLSHEKTQKFRAFQYKCNTETLHDLRFEVELGGHWFPSHYYFMPLVSLSHMKKYYTCRKEDIEIRLDPPGTFRFRPIKSRIRRQIWLYYDCAGISFDNGMLQFLYDVEKHDNIYRFYVVTDERQLPYLRNSNGRFIRFGSQTHKRLLKKSTKILTAYIEEANLLPYKQTEYEKFARHFNAEVIYLQHGVLHIVMPWKYSREKLLADRIVVSTTEEASLYMKNGYKYDDLIKTGMPRFDILSKSKKDEKKILFAPSWRKYLVGDYIDHKWQPLEEKFLSSHFFQETNNFLHSRKLIEILEQTGYKLEVKLHPIFSMYKKFFSLPHEAITFADEKAEDGEYDLFITDFSSYAFNFSFLSIPVIHFIPDLNEFRCGMNGYRELNYPENFWNMVAIDHNALIAKISDALKNGQINEPDSHFFRCKNIRESIYQEIIKKDKGDKNE